MTRSVPTTYNRKPLSLELLMQWTRPKPDGCIVWTRFLNWDGYGAIMCERFKWGAHRLAWALAHGPIPDGYEVDHICFNRACLNLDHLQLLTTVENRRRSRTALSETCRQGHPYAKHLRLQTTNGKTIRKCRECERLFRLAHPRDQRIPESDWKPPKTHCKRGHEFTPENTYTPPGRSVPRTCRQCKRQANQARDSRRIR